MRETGRSIFAVALFTAMVLCISGCDAKDDAGSQEAAPKDISYDKTLTLSAGITVAPYIIQSEDPAVEDSGFEVDIVREIFAMAGYKISFVHEPLKRTKLSFLQKTVDGVMDIKDHYPEIQGSFISDEHITYYNVAFTLESKGLEINTIADLADKKVVAFQQASIAFGGEFEQMTQKNPEYKEMANQENQVSMLFLGRADVIVLDRRIFQYRAERLENIPTDQSVTMHQLFEPSSFRIAFRESEMRDIFNAGLKKIKESGRYAEIVKSYVND